MKKEITRLKLVVGYRRFGTAYNSGLNDCPKLE